jgi:hypothetical protein
MTDLAKNAPTHLQRAVAAMASLAPSLAISRALAVMANQVEMVAAKAVEKALHRVALVWAMQLSEPNAWRWNRPKTRCAAWPRKPTAKC